MRDTERYRQGIKDHPSRAWENTSSESNENMEVLLKKFKRTTLTSILANGLEIILAIFCRRRLVVFLLC